MKIDIICRLTGSVLFSHERVDNTLKITVEVAVKVRANLAGANLAGAYLAGAYLDGAYLDGANLAGAEMSGAYLAGAYLDGAEMSGANLACANLAGAYLDGAYLDGANLAGAYLDGAYLAGAYLDGAEMSGEKLTKAPLSLLNLTWPVLVTEAYMSIGCQRHTHEEWNNFDTDVIKAMEPRALNFWSQWRDVLLAMCKQHRGEA